jgi:hypothetical protein
MTALLDGNYILISRPRYDDELRVWRPYASVSSTGDRFHYHQFNKLVETFETEEETCAFGFTTARHWLDEHKSD